MQSHSIKFIFHLHFIIVTEFSPQIAELIPKSDEPKIKIAFLLTLNGRAVRQVYRLLKLLYSDQHFYYIHVDAVSKKNLKTNKSFLFFFDTI